MAKGESTANRTNRAPDCSGKKKSKSRALQGERRERKGREGKGERRAEAVVVEDGEERCEVLVGQGLVCAGVWSVWCVCGVWCAVCCVKCV